MNELLKKAQTALAIAPSDLQDHTTPLLEQCISILEELRSRNALQPEDFNALDASMNRYNERYKEKKSWFLAFEFRG